MVYWTHYWAELAKDRKEKTQMESEAILLRNSAALEPALLNGCLRGFSRTYRKTAKRVFCVWIEQLDCHKRGRLDLQTVRY